MIGVEDLTGALRADDAFSLVGAGTDAVVHDIRSDAGAAAFTELLDNPAGNRPVAWDVALRLAATRIVPVRNRKAVVAFVNNEPPATAFDTYGLVETARLMANNGIIFHVVYGQPGSGSPELEYIADQTGGTSNYMYRPEGSGIIVR
jgi:hypothetical protein